MELLLALVAIAVLAIVGIAFFVVPKKQGRLVGDGGPHEPASWAETDRKKERATAGTGVRLVRWHVESLWDPATNAGVISEQRP